MTQMSKLKPVADAQEAIFALMGRAESTRLTLQEAGQRVLAEDIHAILDHPAAAVSAMDGYAVQAAGKIVETGTEFDLIGESAAGHPCPIQIHTNQAVRIFTGAHLPSGADSIALQENIDRQDQTITLTAPVASGQFVRPKGMDFAAGEVLLKTGTLLGARHLALAGLAGQASLLVKKKPVVAILSSGDELVSAGEVPKAGQLINSNSIFLANALQTAGAEVVDLGIIPDRPGAMMACLTAHCQKNNLSDRPFDLIVCTGGASVGSHDHIASDLMAGQHSKIDFWRIAMRPGKPLIAAKFQDIPFLGLPGNPVSAGVCSLVFVLPAIRYFLGLPALPEMRQIPLTIALPENDQRQDYIRARAVRTPKGNISAAPFGQQDSSMLRNFCYADMLIIRPPFAPPAKPGDLVSVIDIPPAL